LLFPNELAAIVTALNAKITSGSIHL